MMSAKITILHTISYATLYTKWQRPVPKTYYIAIFVYIVYNIVCMVILYSTFSIQYSILYKTYSILHCIPYSIQFDYMIFLLTLAKSCIIVISYTI